MTHKYVILCLYVCTYIKHGLCIGMGLCVHHYHVYWNGVPPSTTALAPHNTHTHSYHHSTERLQSLHQHVQKHRFTDVLNKVEVEGALALQCAVEIHR